MDTFVLLLRGINVGGRNRLPMADLRSLVASVGFHDVATYLQSGNVVATGPGTAVDAAARVAATIHDELGLTVPVVARSSGEWAAVLAQNPFQDLEDDPTKLHVTFLAAVPDAARVASLVAEADQFAPDRLVVVSAEVFLHCPSGYGRTPLQNMFLERRLGEVATTRNWRTVEALGELIETYRGL